MTPAVQPIDIDAIVLLKGGHRSPDDGCCAMEAYTVVKRLPFSDRPGTVCFTLGAFMRTWNDNAPHDLRQDLKRYFDRLDNTNDVKSVRRAWLLLDWALRERMSEYLDTLDDPKAKECAAGLRCLNQIIGRAELELAIPFLNAARNLIPFALALDLDLAIAPALAIDLDLALDLDLAIAPALAIDLDLDLDLALALDLDLALDPALAIDLDLDLDLALDLALAARQATPGGSGSDSVSVEGGGDGEVEGSKLSAEDLRNQRIAAIEAQIHKSRIDIMERMLAA